MKRHLIGIACIAVLCVILMLGLWPFHAPKNEVAWLTDRNGLRFGDYGTVMSSGTLQTSGSADGPSCSIEIWLGTADADNGGTILAFYSLDKTVKFSLHQSIGDLLLQRGAARAARIYIGDLFQQPQPVFVTITSGTQGTAVYVNGAVTTAAPRFQLASSDCTGRLILGDSPLQQDSWSGQVLGLAVYSIELPAPVVLRHYRAWTKTGQPEVASTEHNVGLYLFNERTGNLVHNHAGSGLDLVIPETYTVVDQIFLEPFWKEFSMSGGFWRGILKNIVGFIPVGLCFFPYFSLVRHFRQAALITVLVGFLVSLTIEVLQAFLPTRDSGMTDLITNTLGTYLGVLVYRSAIIQRRFALGMGLPMFDIRPKSTETHVVFQGKPPLQKQAKLGCES